MLHVCTELPFDIGWQKSDVSPTNRKDISCFETIYPSNLLRRASELAVRYGEFFYLCLSVCSAHVFG